MDNLFEGNLIALYFIVGLGIITYGNFSTSQKIIIIYLVSYLACFLNIFSTLNMIIMSFIMLFIFLEYLSQDYEKIKIFKKIRYKILDLIYLLIFQYYFIFYLLALIFQTELINNLFIKILQFENISLSKIISVILIIAAIHFTGIEKFKVKEISKITEMFTNNKIFEFPYTKIDRDKFSLLVDLEDKSYFVRTNTYNIFSIEFIKYKVNYSMQILNEMKKKKFKNMIFKLISFLKKSKNIRGYSTLEMQLIRTIGIENGYNFKFRRKIYEIIYSQIFFRSLKELYLINYVTNVEYFKEYLIWIYYHAVNIKINNIKYEFFSDAFDCSEVQKWSLEGLFVACMGLSHKTKEYYKISPYINIINKYNIDYSKLVDLYDNIENAKLK